MDHAGLRDHLHDPTRYVVRVGVPVFGPHTKTVDGEPKEVTEAELELWAAQSRTLESATGVAGVLRVGHIRPAEPETNQPPVAGYLSNPRVGTVTLKDGSRVRRLLMDEHVRHEWAPRLPDFPWRSVEMYRPRKQITAVAMLTRDPQLHDLGPANLYQHAGPHGLELYALGADTMADEPKKPDAAADANALTPDEQAFLDKLVPLLVPKIVAAMQQAAPPAPGPTPPPGPTAMSKDKTPEFYALQTELTRQKAERDALAETVKGMQKSLAEQKAREVLSGLAAELYSFDAAEEMAAMTATDDAGRAKRAAYIRKHHGKVPPADAMIETYAGLAEPGSTGVADEQRQHRAATRLMLDNPGMGYETALREVAKGK
jgi:hypothetical protein